MPLGKNKIIITGGTGFLGREIHDYLSKKYDFILTPKKKKKNFIHLDYPKKKLKNKDFKKIKTIIHLASLDRDQVKKNYRNAKKINYDLTKDLIDLSIKNRVQNFIYISSVSVYGKNLHKNVHENIKPKPIDRYSKLKLMCEKLLQKKSNKQKVLILRLSNIIGTPVRITKGYQKLFLPSICLSALKQNKIVLKTNGNQYRDFLELNVFLKILKLFLIKIDRIDDFSVFNISSYHSLKIIDVATKVRLIFKSVLKKNIKIIKGKKINEKKFLIDNNKMKKFLNFKVKSNHNKLLIHMINFLKNETRIS